MLALDYGKYALESGRNTPIPQRHPQVVAALEGRLAEQPDRS